MQDFNTLSTAAINYLNVLESRLLSNCHFIYYPDVSNLNMTQFSNLETM